MKLSSANEKEGDSSGMLLVRGDMDAKESFGSLEMVEDVYVESVTTTMEACRLLPANADEASTHLHKQNESTNFKEIQKSDDGNQIGPANAEVGADNSAMVSIDKAHLQNGTMPQSDVTFDSASNPDTGTSDVIRLAAASEASTSTDDHPSRIIGKVKEAELPLAKPMSGSEETQNMDTSEAPVTEENKEPQHADGVRTPTKSADEEKESVVTTSVTTTMVSAPPRMIESSPEDPFLIFNSKFTEGGVYVPVERPAEPRQPVTPVVKFDSVSHFAFVHRAATEKELALESRNLTEYNHKRNVYTAWDVATISVAGEATETHLVIVELPHHTEQYLQQIGQKCNLEVVDPITKIPVSVAWDAERLSTFPIEFHHADIEGTTLFFFKITLSVDENGDGILQPLVSRGLSTDNAGIHLTDANSIAVCLNFLVSETTAMAEIGALDRLIRSDDTRPVDVHQKDAFEYLATFEFPARHVDLFAKYPHMRDPTASNSNINASIVARYERLDHCQREAYHGLLPNLPCGIGILPGGPGSGKTHWVLTVAGLMQSGTKAKVLYILDINRPLDDCISKYASMCRTAGLRKLAVRVKPFGKEMANSAVLKSLRESGIAPQDQGPGVDFSRAFVPMFKHEEMRPDGSSGMVPSLDEAAWSHYDQHRNEYQELTQLLEEGNFTSRAFKWKVYGLYRDVLKLADFVATTPCAASGPFSRLFRPNMVIVDEAAHARELATLIPIAYFDKAVWLFIGDFRQTLPFVRNTAQNPWSPQLLVSTMERAHHAGVIKFQLLTNHRAYGDLQRLPSNLIYDGKMISGIEESARQPNSLQFVRRYLERFMGGKRCVVPRLVAKMTTNCPSTRVNMSWLNKVHTHWTMLRVEELLRDDRFRNVGDPSRAGTILLISPYKEAVKEYANQIKRLDERLPGMKVADRVEARTWDVSQGHEADIICIDYARTKPTSFMDGMHRFNVGLTRARQGEIHIMSYRLIGHDDFSETTYLSQMLDACLDDEEGHVVQIDDY